MDDSRALLKSGNYRAAIQRAHRSNHAIDILSGAMAAMAMEDLAGARQLLQRLSVLVEPALEAERLSAWARLHYLAGDLEASYQLAQQAVQLEQNYDTLFQLGQFLPPEQAVPVLKESLARATSPREEGQVAFALARVLERLGRFREGLSYASLAVLRDPEDPMLGVVYANLLLTGGENVTWDELAGRLQNWAQSPVLGIQMAAQHALIEISLIQGNLEQARQQSEQLMSKVDRNMLPLVVWQAVRVYLLLGRKEKALQLARAAELSEISDPRIRGLARIALGNALYPASQSEAVFEEAVGLLEGVSVGPAVVARAFLASLRGEMLSSGDLELIEQWSAPLRQTLPESIQTRRFSHTLRVLGQGTLTGPQGVIPLRLRSLELLVLLASKPDGWKREDLAVALYGEFNLNAVKVELTRLKKALGGKILPKPWRLAESVRADFLEVQRLLFGKDLVGALRLYRGPLLPRSDAPGIEELRHELEEVLRQAGLASRDPEALMTLGECLPEDLEIWEALMQIMPQSDPRFYAVLSRGRRLRQKYFG